jgi:transcriptional regulator with XRE-family HTH domain
MLTLTAIRLQKGWSKSELARRAQLSASTVCQIESGRLLPYPGQLAKIARAFNMTDGNPSALMDAADERSL